MSFRKPQDYLNIEWFTSLNLIDVYFYDEPRVISVWREYSQSLVENSPNIVHHDTYRINLLYEMGKSLGYNNLSPVDYDRYYIDRYYIPMKVRQQIQ